jgi:hypothetical protein
VDDLEGDLDSDVGTILEAKTRLVGLAVNVGDDAREHPVVERREDLGRVMDQLTERAACDGNAQSREVLFGAVGRHRVAALADDEVRDEAGTVLRALAASISFSRWIRDRGCVVAPDVAGSKPVGHPKNPGGFAGSGRDPG